MLLYSIIAFIITILLIILTSKYIGEKLYPAITFITMIVVSVFWIKNNCWNLYTIIIDNDNFSINNKSYKLSDIEKYSFNDTEQFYGLKIFFKSKTIFLSVSKKNSLDYLKFKEDFIRIIQLQNQKDNRVIEYDWYKTKSAKVYGYITAIVIIAWIAVMFVYPEKLKFSNLGLFFIVLAGLSPILLKIFGNKLK